MEAANRLSLWQITEAEEVLAEKLMATGGIISPELEVEWDALQGSFEAKVERVSLYIRELMANATAAKEEADRLAEIHTAFALRASRLKNYVLHHMNRTGRKKVETPRVRTRIQANGGRVSVAYTGMLADLPDDFVRVTREPDIERAHVALAAGKELPAGFVVKERGSHLRIE